MQWSRPGYALALALLVTAPLLAPGYLLLRDAVSTPRSYLSDSALGLMSAPRAVPQDFAVALASHGIDGGIVVKALLIAALWLAGWGAARLVAAVLPEAGASGQFVAITLAIWNPYVAERMLQGHWSLLVGYGCLPWVATTMLMLRSEDPPVWSRYFALVWWIALAGLTPTGLMLAATVALVCVAAPGAGRPRWRCAAVSLGAAVVAALPWLTASALSSALPAQQDSAIAAFAARAEPGLGTLGSLAGLGGIWNADAVPASRTTLFAVLSTVVLVGVVVTGLPALRRHRAAVPLIVVAAVAVLVPAALATGPGLAVLRVVVDVVPGLGVVRDGQKWVALAMPGYALAGAGAVQTLRRWAHPAATALICCAALICVLPDLAWGGWGKVEPVHYPSGWRAVAAAINDDTGPVAVLPTGTMRRFGWSGPQPVLDPLPRWLRADVLATGDLTISGISVPGEGRRARVVEQLVVSGADPDALARAGVRWLVVERRTPGELGAAARVFGQLPIVYQDDDLALYSVGGHAPGAPAGRRSAVLIAHLAWLAMLGVGAVGMAAAGWRRRVGRTARSDKDD
ncbi:hypothetical protein A5707_11785 [Mycobacterium kyorinense]|uniref:Transmembrane protein n=1 Tax=Mycobacterium kyorinense TaxID=487514 RepID=A0A1A2ZRZ3_9MYCO|nr:hypothetical protein [Mycobacterium kyorinense]OBI53349.1 hypothetical protein A5707_11785 [Mycobacterium kyorinense]